MLLPGAEAIKRELEERGFLPLQGFLAQTRVCLWRSPLQSPGSSCTIPLPCSEFPWPPPPQASVPTTAPLVVVGVRGGHETSYHLSPARWPEEQKPPHPASAWLAAAYRSDFQYLSPSLKWKGRQTTEGSSSQGRSSELEALGALSFLEGQGRSGETLLCLRATQSTQEC